MIGQDWQGDVRVVLFVKLREGLTLDDELRQRIGNRVRANTTPRHVPARIIQVQELPHTKSGKLVEIERLDYVIVRSAVEALDPVLDRVALEIGRRIMPHGKPGGAVMLSAGKSFPVLLVAEDGIVVRFSGAKLKLPVDKTDLAARLAPPEAPAEGRGSPPLLREQQARPPWRTRWSGGPSGRAPHRPRRR